MLEYGMLLNIDLNSLLQEEESYIVWSNITDNLCVLHSVLSEHQECKQQLNQFIQDLYSKIRLKVFYSLIIFA